MKVCMSVCCGVCVRVRAWCVRSPASYNDALPYLLLSSRYHGGQSRAKDAELSRRLERVEAELAPAAPAAMQRRLEAVAAAARLRGGGGGGTAATRGDGVSNVKLDDKALLQLFGVLRDHVDGVKQLQDVLKRDALDLVIMKRLSGDNEAGDTVMG